MRRGGSARGCSARTTTSPCATEWGLTTRTLAAAGAFAVSRLMTGAVVRPIHNPIVRHNEPTATTSMFECCLCRRSSCSAWDGDTLGAASVETLSASIRGCELPPVGRSARSSSVGSVLS